MYDNHVHSKLRRNNQTKPDMDLPSPADMKCTQHAGHGVAMPSELPHHQHQWEGTVPRNTGREVLAADGDAMRVVHATPHKGKEGPIPKEFWATSVNLQWHDTRNDLSRQRNGGATALSAQEKKRLELSSEVMGSERLLEASTREPRRELLADTAHIMAKDSALDRHLHPRSGDTKGGYPGAHDAHDTTGRHAHARFHNNLRQSELMTLESDARQAPLSPAHMPDEDAANLPRRRGERNFSDLFDTQMAEKSQARSRREEVTATRSCSFLDTRSEIAARNTQRWRQDPSHTAQLRYEQEVGSSLFDRPCPQRPEVEEHYKQIDHNERICWDTKDIMQSGSEIARRVRNKDHHREDVGSAYDRKQADMASTQIGVGMGAPPRYPATSSPRACSPRNLMGSSRKAQQDRADVTAKNTKIASLQSSIFA